MAKFIKVKDSAGKDLIINVETIAHIENPSEDYIYVRFTNNSAFSFGGADKRKILDAVGNSF